MILYRRFDAISTIIIVGIGCHFNTRWRTVIPAPLLLTGLFHAVGEKTYPALHRSKGFRNLHAACEQGVVLSALTHPALHVQNAHCRAMPSCEPLRQAAAKRWGRSQRRARAAVAGGGEW
jgi:hypothetical protein